jgi:hypothetical protein
MSNVEYFRQVYGTHACNVEDEFTFSLGDQLPEANIGISQTGVRLLPDISLAIQYSLLTKIIASLTL